MSAMMRSLFPFALLACLVSPTALDAQDASSPSGLALGIGTGFAQGSFTDRPGDGSGVVGAVEIATLKDGKRRWIFEAQVEPFEVKKDGRDEHYTAVSFQVGRVLGPFVLALGLQSRSWEGVDRVTDSDMAVTLSVQLSPFAFPLGAKWSLRPDIFWRSHAADEITSRTIGVRVFLVLGE
jgi:hypothetical protein